MERKTVIIFTYYWPPVSSGGVWRWLKMSKYLPDFNWTPIIITVRDGSFSAYDESILDDIAEDLEVHKTKSYDPYLIYNRLQGKNDKSLPEAMAGAVESGSVFQRISYFIRANFFIPDPKIGWVRFAYLKGKELIKTRRIDAIITTGPPQSVHLIGKKLKSQFKDLPWVMDMRDPWTSNYMVTEFMKRTRMSAYFDRRLETKTLKLADAVTGISPGLVSEFEDRNQNIKVVYNGFDEADFQEYAGYPSELFALSYIGSLKPNMNIITLWETIGELLNQNPDFRTYFRLQFVGNLNPHIVKVIHEYGIENNLILKEFVPHHQAIDEMSKSQMLLFIVPRATYAKNITSGKVFEYLASTTPMLSLGPVDGNAAWILKKAEREPMIDYDDKESIKKRLLSAFNTWLNSGKMLKKHDTESYKFFSRKRQTQEFVLVLNEIMHSANS